MLCVPSNCPLYSPVLWSSSDQTPLAFKARFTGYSFSHCWPPRLRSLTSGLELSILWKTFCDVSSSLWATHLAHIRFDLIMITSCYYLVVILFCLWIQDIFLGVSILSLLLLLMVVWLFAVILVSSQEVGASIFLFCQLVSFYHLFCYTFCVFFLVIT